MKKVLFKAFIELVFDSKNKRVEGTGVFQSGFLTKGEFHQWGLTYEECGENAGNYTVALIELEDGTIKEVLPNNIQFIY